MIILLWDLDVRETIPGLVLSMNVPGMPTGWYQSHLLRLPFLISGSDILRKRANVPPPAFNHEVQTLWLPGSLLHLATSDMKVKSINDNSYVKTQNATEQEFTLHRL